MNTEEPPISKEIFLRGLQLLIEHVDGIPQHRWPIAYKRMQAMTDELKKLEDEEPR